MLFGRLLIELHLTEGRGTGIPTIHKEPERNNSPVPLIESDEQCTYFLTVLPAREDFKDIDLLDKVRSDQESDQVNDQESNQEGNQESNQGSNQEHDRLNIILRYCLEAKSRAEFLKKIGLSNQTKNYKRHIEPLLKKKYLERTIPENPKDRNQKYRTTDKGKKQLKK